MDGKQAIDDFIDHANTWQEEFRQLRTTLLDCSLKEEIKWGKPCYTFQANNIVIMQGFKEYCALLFVKGALLHDPEGIFTKQTENVQAARQIRFTDAQEIIKMEPILKACIQEAIEVEKAGLKVEYKKTADFPLPGELEAAFQENPALQAAFKSLTPGRQRAYLLYFSASKQAKTRTARIEKYRQQILAGKGLND
ncbi:MAG TPA: hypothetical protein DCK95_03040 [Anaerolineaceae bacterium]|nr:hypothetical protein [Anaerolineaceae bacterium]